MSGRKQLYPTNMLFKGSRLIFNSQTVKFHQHQRKRWCRNKRNDICINMNEQLQLFDIREGSRLNENDTMDTVTWKLPTRQALHHTPAGSKKKIQRSRQEHPSSTRNRKVTRIIR
ncbi:hypothetical protein FKM82_003881 [Ascaphus truei]